MKYYIILPENFGYEDEEPFGKSFVMVTPDEFILNNFEIIKAYFDFIGQPYQTEDLFERDNNLVWVPIDTDKKFNAIASVDSVAGMLKYPIGDNAQIAKLWLKENYGIEFFIAEHL